MRKRGKALLVLAVAITAAIIAAAAWFVCERAADDVDVTQLPGAMKLVATVATEASPFYGGDVPYLQHLSRGRALPLDPVRETDAQPGMPPLVSPRACSASASYEGQRRDNRSILFFIDESGGKGSGYDRLYADRNADGRFDPEEAVGLLANPPRGGVVPMSSNLQRLVFEPFELQTTPSEPPRSLVARLAVAADGSSKYLFLGEALRAAKATLGGVECNVFLHSWFPNDYNGTLARQVIEYGPAQIADYWPGNLWSINGAIYRLSAAPRGETLTVEEYAADAGTIEMGLGAAWKGVTVEQVSVSGGNTFVKAAGPLLEQKGELRVPAGRYHPVEMSLAKGAGSCYLMGTRRDGKEPARRLRVSGGGRSRLELPAEPEVTFIKPGKEARIRGGDYLEVEALLGFPGWELCFRSITVRADAAGGSTPAKQLEPQAVVRDSSGHVVAQGPMPFG